MSLPRPFLPLLLGLSGVQGDPGPLPEPQPEITRAELEHHVRELASDANEGRPMFSAGNLRAGEYLARALAQAGVAPGGPDGSWFQDIPIQRVEYPEPPRLLWKDQEGATHEARLGVDYDLEIRGRARSTEMLPVRVFYDYSANRIPGQGDPGMAIFFGGDESTREALLERYKIGDLEDWGLEITARQGETGYGAGRPVEGLRPRTLLGDADGCERVELRGELRSAIELGKLTHVQLLVSEVDLPSHERNVVGLLRGKGTAEDPGRADEAVLLSAHYDHIGVRGARGRRAADEDRDRLCNGADDNASGCATLLELAQVFAHAGPQVRTLVFLFTTGEEAGGVGIRHYVEHPVVPLEKTVAHLNLEMLGRPDPVEGFGPGRLWLTGDDRSTLLAAWTERGLAIGADPHPRERFFLRSDNYAVALRGVVAQTLSSFGLHEDYHRPSDEADTLDYAHLETVARLVRTAVAPLADGTVTPVWLEGKQPLPVGERVRRAPERSGRDVRPGRGGEEEDEDAEAEDEDDG